MKKSIITVLLLIFSAGLFAKVIVSSETSVIGVEWNNSHSMHFDITPVEDSETFIYTELGYKWNHRSEFRMLQNTTLSVCYEFPSTSEMKWFAGINGGISPWNFTGMVGITGGFSVPLFSTNLYQFDLQGKVSTDFIGDVFTKGFFVQPGINILMKDAESDSWFLTIGLAPNNSIVISKEEIGKKSYKTTNVLTGICTNFGIGIKL